MDSNVIFRNKFGQLISDSSHSLPPVEDNVVISLREKLEDRHIHAQTCVTKWEGEVMDRELAVGHLSYLTETAKK
jgi:hypothetical protein